MDGSLRRRLAALEEQTQQDTPPPDLLGPRVVDYRAALDPAMPQTGPIIIRWVDAATPTKELP